MPPPDDNAAVDPTATGWVVWLVVVAPGLLLATVACVRLVGPGELLVVVRRGRVVRARRRGLVARWPGAEVFASVPAGPRVLPLVVRARTRDGVDVVATADLTLEVRRVAPGSSWVPDADVVRLAEDTVAAHVETLAVTTLVDDLADLEERCAREVARGLPAGTAVRTLEVLEVEARLTPDGPR